MYFRDLSKDYGQMFQKVTSFDELHGHVYFTKLSVAKNVFGVNLLSKTLTREIKDNICTMENIHSSNSRFTFFFLDEKYFREFEECYSKLFGNDKVPTVSAFIKSVETLPLGLFNGAILPAPQFLKVLDYGDRTFENLDLVAGFFHWCYESLKDRVYLVNGRLFFPNADDATLYKMKWGGSNK